MYFTEWKKICHFKTDFEKFIIKILTKKKKRISSSMYTPTIFENKKENKKVSMSKWLPLL